MASQKDIEATYDWVDGFHELRLGKHADYTCAFFDGDFAKTLYQAQKDKHEYALKGITFKPGRKVLDIGCGWGPILQAVKDKGGVAVGFTLSPAQRQSCVNQGLDARLQDYKAADPERLGEFDGIVCIGALEHFCSIEEFKDGRQDEIYRNFFRFCNVLLPSAGRLYLQTMVWGKKVPDSDKLSLDAPKGSDELIVAKAATFYPGSWLPTGKEQLAKDAEPYFKLISSNNGRLDYIETLDRWDKSIRLLYTTWRIFPTAVAALKLLPRFLTSRAFRTQLSFVRNKDQAEIFRREIFSHERMIFEKI